MSDFLPFVMGPLPGTALPFKYDYALVVLSYVVASLAAYTAIDLAGRVSEFRSETRRADISKLWRVCCNGFRRRRR